MKHEAVSIHCDIYHRNEKVGRLDIEKGKLIRNEAFTDNLLLHPCAKSTTALQILGILADRVICESRCEDVMLKSMGLKEYNVFDVFKANHGIDIDDFIWFKFDDDRKDLCWEDIIIMRG